jgi:hypothetical protein
MRLFRRPVVYGDIALQRGNLIGAGCTALVDLPTGHDGVSTGGASLTLDPA